MQKRTSVSKFSGDFEFQTPPGQLKKGHSQRGREKAGKRTRDPVKFGVDLSSSDSDSDGDELRTPPGRPWFQHRFASPPVSVGFAASLTKIGKDNIDVEMAKVKMGLRPHDENPEYSDFEENDVTSAAVRTGRDAPGWSPEFIRRHQESGGTSMTSQRTVVERSHAKSPALVPDGAVPMTSSLIKAVDRVAIAQQAAFAATEKSSRLGLPPSKFSDPATLSGLPRAQGLIASPPSSTEEDKGASWDVFWRDVRERAALAR